MKKYKLQKYGNLFFTTGAIKGSTGIVMIKFLIDTGSTYTIVPWEAVEKIEKESSVFSNKVRIATANGYVYAPILKINWIHSLGLKFEQFPIVIHTLPTGILVKGILGMDFLTKAGATLDIAKEQIVFKS